MVADVFHVLRLPLPKAPGSAKLAPDPNPELVDT